MNAVKARGLAISHLPESDVRKLRETAREKVWEPYLRKVDDRSLKGTESFQDH